MKRYSSPPELMMSRDDLEEGRARQVRDQEDRRDQPEDGQGRPRRAVLRADLAEEARQQAVASERVEDAARLGHLELGRADHRDEHGQRQNPPGQARGEQAAGIGQHVAAVRKERLLAGDALEDHDEAGKPDEQERDRADHGAARVLPRLGRLLADDGDSLPARVEDRAGDAGVGQAVNAADVAGEGEV